MSNMTIPLNSFVNTADDFIIKSIDTQEKDVLNKKNSLQFKSVLSPMFTKAEAKVFTTSGHTITKTSNQVFTDENGRTYAVDNSFVIDDVVDISNLWSGELTSALCKGTKVYSVWKNERDYTLVISDFDNNILKTVTNVVDQTNLLYYNVKLANYTREASKSDGTIRLALQIVKTTPQTTIAEYTIDPTSGEFTVVRTTDYAYLTGKDLYVLFYRQGSTNYLAVGTDDTDLRKRFTFVNGAVKFKYWGCLGANGLVTGEPVLTTVSTRANNTTLSSITITQDDFTYLDNGIGYGQQISSTGTDAQDIASNSSLNGNTITSGTATTWGTYTRTRTGTKAYVAGYDLQTNIPLILSPNYSNARGYNGAAKRAIVALPSAKYTAPTVAGTNLIIEQVDFSDAWGNLTWNNGTAAITNGCNPFPYKYSIMNRAESKGRYWDYGPGWARCYFRQGIIKQQKKGNDYRRGFAEEYPTAIISFGLSSFSSNNSVRIEYLDPITLVSSTGVEDRATVSGWANDAEQTGRYYKYHLINDDKSHIWVNFVGASNLGDQTLLGNIPFNVDVNPALNIKDQYFGLQYMSTSMQGTLLTSASVSKHADSMIFIENTTTAAMFSNGLVMKGVKSGTVKLTKIADYIYRTNTLTGNNLFVDSDESFYGQRGFIAYNGEEMITLDVATGKTSPLDDNDTEGNDNYFTASGYNENMTNMKKRAVSYLLPAIQLSLAVQSSQVEDFTYQLASNKKEITKPILYNQFTYKDDGVAHYYTHSLDTTDIKYQTTKVMESNASGDTRYFGVATYDSDKENFTWYITATAYYYPMGLASIVTGINYLASNIDMTDDYTVRLYRTKNSTFPVYNPTTEVYKGSTIFTIYGYNYSFDGQAIYYLGSGDTTSESSFACYALGMQFLANSGTEAYFYSPFEKRLYLFTGSNTLQIADSLAREGKIIDSLYSSCEQILYMLTEDGNIIAKSQNDMAVIENIDTAYHFEGTDSGMILVNGFNYKKYRLYKTDETEWLPLEFETEYLGKNDSLFKNAIVDITFFRYNKDDTVSGKVYCDIMHDNMPKRITSDFKITSKDWDATALKKIEFTFPNNVGKAFRFGIESDDYISIASFTMNLEEVSQNTNAPKHR